MAKHECDPCERCTDEYNTPLAEWIAHLLMEKEEDGGLKSWAGARYSWAIREDLEDVQKILKAYGVVL